MAERINIPVISAPAWNELLVRLAGKLNITYAGRRDTKVFRHPWNTLARYDPFKSAWEINIQPGMVNAQDVDAPPINRVDAPDVTQERDSADKVRPWLVEAPWISLPGISWRKLGTDASGLGDTEGVPLFFQALGVGMPPREDLEIAGSGVSITVDPLPDGVEDEVRLLRAADVVLSIPKPTAVAESVEDGSKISFAFTIRPAPPGNPSIYVTPRFDPEDEDPTAQEQILTGRGGSSAVKRVVATLFLVSPAGAEKGSDPDHTWIPFVRHYLFYNLAFSHKATITNFPPLELELPTGLAGGVADGIFQRQLADINQADAGLAQALSNASVRTDIWSV
ncbi:MAG: hypothetical protein QM496_13970 [Verrucomicrobiota bacterium]